MSSSSLQSVREGTARPRILLTDTNRWPLGPRLAIGFSGLGCDVSIVCPSPGHPAAKTRAMRQTLRYAGSRPLVSLKNAIDAVSPDIILPLCDRSVQHLHALHAKEVAENGSESKVVRLIERSLGAPESFEVLSSRYQLLETARSEGIRVPEMVAIHSAADLDRWCKQTPAPWVIKADGSWGGRGVRVVRTLSDAQQAWVELSQRPTYVELVKRLSLNRERAWILADWKHSRPSIMVQSHIHGRPANCAVVCWQGKLLAGIAVEVLQALGPTEPAIVVQVVEGKEMLRAAELLAKRLNLSGFLGLDFMIEEGTGSAYLIEMNPRCTPPCPLALGKGRDLLTALQVKLANLPLKDRKPVTERSRITYFPRSGKSANEGAEPIPLESTYYDVPQGEPGLVQALLHPWSLRSYLGQALDWARATTVRKKALPTCVFEDALVSVKPEHAVDALPSELRSS